MKIIFITQPDFFPHESEAINHILQSGNFYLHLRKPESDIAQMRALIEAIKPEYRDRIVLNDHHQLAVEYGLGGIHLNSRNPLPLNGFAGTVSRSCHSVAELAVNPHHCNYSFLSPIFDSISKPGYNSAFSPEVLISARQSGLITGRVYALGGVTLANLPTVADYGFGGAAILGEIRSIVHSDLQSIASHSTNITDAQILTAPSADPTDFPRLTAYLTSLSKYL